MTIVPSGESNPTKKTDMSNGFTAEEKAALAEVCKGKEACEAKNPDYKLPKKR